MKLLQLNLNETKDLQCDADLRNTFRCVRLLDFCKVCISADKFLVLNDHRCTWQAFSKPRVFMNVLFKKMKVIKSKYRNRLDDESWESRFRVSTSPVRPDIED
jgi:hypothetical protein